MHDKLVVIEQQYLKDKTKNAEQTVLMMEITGGLEERWSTYYFNLKSFVQVIAKSHRKKH